MTTLTVTISDKLQVAGAMAAWIVSNNPDYPDAQAYLQRLLEDSCKSYASQFSVDRITSGEFVLRFTGTEIAVITSEAENDATIAKFLDATRANATVRLADSLVAGGLQYLVEKQLLTQDRVDVIGFYPLPEKPKVEETIVQETPIETAQLEEVQTEPQL